MTFDDIQKLRAALGPPSDDEYEVDISHLPLEDQALVRIYLESE